jgi:hypothetical protein
MTDTISSAESEDDAIEATGGLESSDSSAIVVRRKRDKRPRTPEKKSHSATRQEKSSGQKRHREASPQSDRART